MQSLKRFLEISFRLLPAITAYLLTRRAPESEKARRAQVRVRTTLQELGTTFIKLGQLLSARPDIAGAELAAELRNLLDKEPVIPFPVIRQIIEAETKMPLDRTFKSIDPTPLGSASIAQVHKGVLVSGATVAIKVQRPGIEAAIARDLPVLSRTCRLLDSLALSKSIKLSYLYAEFEEWITNELDFQVEGRRADTFREHMKGMEGIIVPRVWWKHTSRRVLVLEFIEGTTLNALLDIMREQNAATLQDAKLPFPVDTELVIKRAVASVARQALVDRYFHGDLHPANIIIGRHSSIAFVDFGIIGTINAEEHTQIMLTLVALVQNDPEMLTKVFKSLAVNELSAPDVAAVHQQLSDELHRLQEDSSSQAGLSHFMNVIFGISQRYTLMFTQGYIIAMKTIAQIDSVATYMGLRSPLVVIMKPEVEKCLAVSLSQELSADTVSGTLLNLVEAGKQLPKSLSEFEALVRSGELLRPGVAARKKAFSRGSVLVSSLLVAAAPAVFWFAPSGMHVPLLAILLPLFLLFILVTILISEGD